MKKCTRCQVEKEESQFSKKTKNRIHSHCKNCQSVLHSIWYFKHKKRRIKQVLLKKKSRSIELDLLLDRLKSNPCTDCKQQLNPWQMDFDHLKDKKFEIGMARIKGYAIKSVLEELKKCELVCANCHRNRTYYRRRKEKDTIPMT